MLKNIKLKEHNLETYNIIKKTYEERNHIGVVQATGTGKSFVTAKIIQDMGFKKVLFLAPSIHIITQFKEKFQFLVDNITFLTYKKLTYIKDLEDFLSENNFEFVVLDEYHRCGARTWQKPIKYIISYYKDKKILGVTATPIRYLDNCRDMTRELFNSEPIVELFLSKAMDMNILPKPKYIVSYYDIEDEISNLSNKMKILSNNDTFKNIEYVVKNLNLLVNAEDVLSKNITTERNFIIFCSNINHIKYVSLIISKWFKNIGFETKNYFVYADSKDEKKYKNSKKELDIFKKAKRKDNEVHLLFTINMLNEGIHIDGVEGLIFMRKTVSPTVLYQQLGRALSSECKKTPIIFDFVNNLDRVSFYGNNKESQKCYKKLKNTGIDVDYSIDEKFEVIDYTIKIKNVLEEMEVLSFSSSWKTFINNLIKYKNENGNCNVPSSHNLYKKCLRIRKDYSRGKLDINKVNELDELGFKWDIGTYNDELWNSMFEKLIEFTKIYKHANVPRSYEDKQLATWIQTQRKYKDTMPLERKEKLLDVGFEFEIGKKINEKEWEDMFNRLLEFKDKFNHVNVSSRYQDKKLANWVNSQRKAYKLGKLDSNRCDKLTKIGFVFSRKSI